MEFTIKLTPSQIETFNKIKSTRPNKTDQEIFTQLVERGIYDVNYRSTRNKKVWGEFKEYRRMVKAQGEQD